MDIFQIIKDNMPDGIEMSDKQIKLIAKEIAAQQGQAFVPKESYSKKTDLADELKGRVKELEASAAELEHYKKKLETAKETILAREAELTQYKVSVEAEQIKAKKVALLHAHLTKAGANPRLLDLLDSKFDVDALELSGESIKDLDTLVKPVKEQYAELFGTVHTKGADVATPPMQENAPKNPWLKENFSLHE